MYSFYAAAVDGSQILALGTQHGLWVAARDGIGEEFLLIEMIECHQLATLDGHLVVRSHHTLKSYSLTQLTALMKKRQSQLSPPPLPPPPDVVSPISPVSTTSGTSGSSAYPFQPSSFSDGSSSGSSFNATSTAATSPEGSPQACYPLSVPSTTIKRSSVLDFVTGTLYGCPVLCYVGRTRQHRKLQLQQLQHQRQKLNSRSSYLRHNFKWIRVLVIYTVKPSKRSGNMLSLKKEKVKHKHHMFA